MPRQTEVQFVCNKSNNNKKRLQEKCQEKKPAQDYKLAKTVKPIVILIITNSSIHPENRLISALGQTEFHQKSKRVRRRKCSSQKK